MLNRGSFAALGAAVALLAAAGPARAATLTVDDDATECPAAGYASVQAAVDAAAPGDTVVVCPGKYVEGSGGPGSDAVLIQKSLTIKGAGADLVTITPRATTPVGGRILEDEPDIRNGVGDILAIVGTPSQPITVAISGITVDGWDPTGHPVAVEAGILFLDAKGAIDRSRVTNVVTSEGESAYTRPGGWRGTQPGYGIVQSSATIVAPVDGTRDLKITQTRVDRYNKVGVLIDGAQNDTPPLIASGTVNRGILQADQIVGRTECVNYLGNGNCGNANVALLTTGPLFGQDGVRVTSGARAQVMDSLITQNLVNGTGAPTRNATTNNANLALGAGLRFVGAQLNTYLSLTGITTVNSWVTRSNVIDNAFGVVNVQADGSTPATGSVTTPSTPTDPAAPTISGNHQNVLAAENDYWGLRYTLPSPTNPVVPGPAISPTTNPPVPENPVNGVATPDGTGTTSSSVDFYPFRDGPQADPNSGQFVIVDAPVPVSDAPPAISVSAAATAAPGDSVLLSAAASDDFGVKGVTFYEGATRLGTVTRPPYRLAAAIPAGAACGSTRSYTAIAEDSLGQTGGPQQDAAVQVTCAAPAPTATPTVTPTATATATPTVQASPRAETKAPGPPSIAFVKAPSRIAGAAVVLFAPTAPAGLAKVDVLLGRRTACSVKAAPWLCKISVSGADVGVQALRAVVTDATGATAESSRTVRVPKFAPRALRLRIDTRALGDGQARRTITGTLVLPRGVTAAQGCADSRVTLVIAHGGRSLSNQQLKLSPGCTFRTSITTARSDRRGFSVSGRFGGNTVLSAVSNSRRFS